MAKRKQRSRGTTSGAKRRDEGTPSGSKAPVRALPSWSRWAALALVLGVHALLLASVYNPAPHPGGDNAGYLTLAFSLLDRGEYLDLYDPAEAAHTKYPPGFPLVLAAAMLVGARTWAQFKVISSLAIFATVGLSIAWAWRRRGWELAIAVGAILAFAQAFLYASQWILSDPMFLVLTLVGLVAFDAVAAAPSAEPEGATEQATRAWLGIGIVATIAAFFTRSAGLPLVVAVAIWLVLNKRFKSLAAFAGALGVPAVLWWLRDRALGGPGYTGEFWMVNPYQPDLGQVNLLGLVGRAGTNATQYFGAHIPAGFVGTQGPMVAVLGTALFGLALVSWALRMRKPGVAELFMPLYLGLILLWPEVWSGDRFALPLFPLLIFYAGETVVRATKTAPKSARVAVAAVCVLAFLLPAGRAWNDTAQQASACRQRAAQGPFACHRPELQEFVAAANWASQHADDVPVVVSRKPRMFYALSGRPSIVFPFDTEPEALFSAAEAVGARHVVLDHVDRLAAFYIVPVLEARSDAFCVVRSFGGQGRGVPTLLLGMRPSAPAPPSTPADARAEGLTLPQCPDGPFGPMDGQSASARSNSGVVPLLAGLDS